jgi:hypothetical protein
MGKHFPTVSNKDKSFIVLTAGAVFTALHYLCNLPIGLSSLV